MITNKVDYLGKSLEIGDEIVVCYDKNGYFSRASIIGERSDKVWQIMRKNWTSSTNIDKNPARIIKVC